MKRSFVNEDILTIPFTPPGTQEACERILGLFPDEWDEIIATPQIGVTEDGAYYEYIGVAFCFLRDKRYVAFLVDSPDVLSNFGDRYRYVRKVNYAFAHPESAVPAPETEWEVYG